MQSTFLSLRRAARSLLAIGALAASSPYPARADGVTPPAVPGDIAVEPENEPFLIGHAVGTQNYVCAPSGDGVAFVLFTPQATLFNDDGRQITTHFFSPTPVDDVVRATWQHSRDTSTFWGRGTGSSTDRDFVADGAIAWLRIEMVDVEEGPTGGDALTGTTFIQRVNTRGGVAPATGCSSPSEVGDQAFVPYTADYVFYRKARRP
jgi:hypothetical protein